MNFTCNQAFQEAHNIFLWRDSNLIQIIEYPTKVLAWKMAQYFSINLKGRGWLNTPVTFSPLESSTETTCKKNLQAKTQEQIKTWWNYCQVTNSGKTIFLKNKPNWRTNNGIWNKLIKINNNNLDPPYCFFVDGWRIFFQIWKFFQIFHCVKSVQIRSFSGPYFPVFGVNTERYSVFSTNAGNTDQRKLRIWTFFTQFSLMQPRSVVDVSCINLQIVFLWTNV